MPGRLCKTRRRRVRNAGTVIIGGLFILYGEDEWANVVGDSACAGPGLEDELIGGGGCDTRSDFKVRCCASAA